MTTRRNPQLPQGETHLAEKITLLRCFIDSMHGIDHKIAFLYILNQKTLTNQSCGDHKKHVLLIGENKEIKSELFSVSCLSSTVLRFKF